MQTRLMCFTVNTPKNQTSKNEVRSYQIYNHTYFRAHCYSVDGNLERDYKVLWMNGRFSTITRITDLSQHLCAIHLLMRNINILFCMLILRFHLIICIYVIYGSNCTNKQKLYAHQSTKPEAKHQKRW